MRLRRPRLPSFSAFAAAMPTRPASGGSGPFRTRVVLPAVLVALVGGLVPVTLVAARPSIQMQGLPQGAVVGADRLADLKVRVAADGAATEDVRVRLDGKPLQAKPEDGTLVVDLPEVSDGRHTLSVRAKSLFGLASAATQRTFTVDTKAPTLDVPGQLWASSFTEPFTLEGKALGATRVSVGGERVQVSDGAFTVQVARPPATVELTATDAAGNTTRETVSVGVEHPGMRAVHMSIYAWQSDALREPIMDMIRAGKINTIELDIKGEAGYIGYDSDVPLADKINADRDYYNVEKVAEKLDKMGVRLVGRLVCFQDHVLAEAAWKSGHRERVVQTPGGSPFSGGYGAFAFTNFANEQVRQYNIDLAVEAVKRGFDGILFDYIRRPDGYRDNMVFPGLDEKTPSESITAFVKKSAQAIHEAGGFVGVSVFGIAATRPESVAQNIPQMAKYADYISPMVYPSHWGRGEYGVARPNSQPYKIVKRSLKDFKKAVEGTDAVIIPWLQDFSLGVAYGPEEVHAQIEAARDIGLDSFLLWDAGVTYTSAALDPPG